MALHASEEDINTVVEFTGHAVSKDEAAQLLKISNYDVQTAVNKVLEAPHGVAELLKQGDTSWDGTAFGGDRYGQYEPGNTNIPCVENGQESGIIGNAGTAGVLRPATQAYYDNAAWALVPATKSTEYIPDASLSYQKRGDEPGFIKPILNKDLLPPLITILHSIPLIRNALLAPGILASNYWRGEDWWKGSGSATSIIIDNGTGPEAAPELELLYETQRLIAFLDSSDRTYASLDSIFKLDAWKDAGPPEEPTFIDDDLLKYLLRWGWAYQKHVPEARLDGVLRSTVDAGGDRENSYVLDATVVPDSLPTAPTLYDVLDNTLFVSQTRSAHIVDISSVLIFRLSPSKDGSKLNCTIPAILYADRYIEENRAAVNTVFAEKEQFAQMLTSLDAQVEKLKYHTPQKVQYSQKMETLTLLKTSMKAFESDTESMTESPRDVAVLAQLQTLYQNIERKLSWLEEEKKKAQAALDKISERFRAPMEQSDQVSGLSESASQHKFAHPYKLCGVATSSSDFYVCHPANPSNEPDAKQWWHISYFYSTADDTATVERQHNVLKEVSENSERALIVYANNAATSSEPKPLSAKLETFVKKDNANFQQEVAREEAMWGSNFNSGNEVVGDWMNNAENDWNTTNTEPHHAQVGSTLSSATLTPNTDNEDDSVPIELPIEMQEVNGGIAAWAGISNASSETVGIEPMDLPSDGRKSQASMRTDDVQMVDADMATGHECATEYGIRVRPRSMRVLQIPLQPSTPLANGYLEAASQSRQPLCGSSEGWGPISRDRYDFTPCFLDVWIAAVAAAGILGGAGAAWYLLKNCTAQPVKKNWHFYAKLTTICALFVTTALQAALQIEYYKGIWAGDFRFWATILNLVSLGVIFYVQYIEHWRSRNANGVVLFYWLFLLIAYAVKLRSLVSQKIHREHVAYFAVFCVSVGLAGVEFLLEWLVQKRLSDYDALGDDDECPYEYADVFSVLTFGWMTPMMKRGYKTFLTQDDLWNLRHRDSTRTSADAFEQAWAYELEKKRPSLWIAMFRAFSGPYFRGGLIKTVSDALNFVQPQLLRLLISFVASYKTDKPQPVARGAAIAIAMFAVSVSQTACLHQYFQRSFETGMRIKASLTAAIYSKSTRLSNEGRATKTTGDIVNYMAVDTQRLQDLAQYGQQLWSAPFQIVLCMLSLYQLLGWSMFAGVAAMIIMIPINGYIARLMKTLQKEQMKNKDARTRLMTEILNNMKSIKLYAWTTAFINRLNHIRNDQELKTLRKIGATQAFSNFTWSTTPFLVSCSTFGVFVLTQHKALTTEIVFPALTLFNLLTFPLAILPMVITAIVEASVAVGRITSFLTAEELQEEAVIWEKAVEENGEESVRVREASFTWNRHEERGALYDINFSAHKGELACIVGRVGAGKSSLLQAVLGDLWKTKGEVVVRGKTAYVPQSAWVMNASVRENIVFGHRWDAQFYEQTVNACALRDDFATLPDGDQTEVGERGISLSGGQKARLTLARAVYARADIYLLDDCLSAVDQHVGRHLIDKVLGPKGLLAGKTRILATNSIPVLMESDLIVLLREGKILEKGTYDQLMAMKGEIANLIRTSQNEDQSEADSRASESVVSEEETVYGGTSPVSDDQDQDEAEAAQENTHLAPLRTGNGTARKSSFATLRRASTASFKGPRGKVVDEEGGGLKSKQEKEFSEQGKVKWSVYGEYAKVSNLTAVGFYLALLIGAQTASIGGSVWLKNWSEVNQKYGGNPNVGKYIGIYFAFGVGSAALSVVQTLILWIFCSIEASRKLHERMAFAIFRSPMNFFETTPAGRILNRFSSDVYRVDEVLARTFNMLFVNSARACFTLVIVSVTTPGFIALIVPLGALYLYIQRYYLRTSRELKRLDSISRSPIYAHFQESLSGMSTIRAYHQQKRFELENEWRVDANLRAYFPSISANRWLAVRLEFIGSVIILASAGFAIISVASNSGLSAGMVGLAMSYALQITQSLNWIVRQTVEVETNIVSVERVLEYAALPSEAPEIISKNRPPISWPSRGAVSFHNYSTRYRPGLDLVLKNINIDIKPHEKIGVVGRTGAGKSSLTMALFRIIEPAEGNVSIDNLNTSTIGLLDLRRRLAIIPQDAALFEGTVRDNLDPGHVHDDTELWSVLEHARLKDHVASMPGRLDAQINEGGSNLSAGQRQLVSLARALLAPSNILVLDEATAAVDVETDAMLQATLRSSMFRNRTIITIAHRINTILDSDRIIVLDHGKVAEFDTPAQLVRSKGLFYELVREANLLNSLDVTQT
ncbi:ATP-binding cassette glutathione S-conjugate transporter ycf1 [Kalmusia sp. IMI 367209]|nr:ATP-binding cassette glutathione S-conjugate transporter ycf1 [Kalmusia sp. IMI 367209]